VNIQEFDPQTQKWLSQFEAAMADTDKRRAFIDSPLVSLQELGGAIDPSLQEAVARGIQTTALTYEFQNKQLKTLSKGKAKKKSSRDMEEYFHLKVEWWGIVIRVDHAAIAELPKGLDAVGTLAEAAFGVVEAAGEAGPLAVLVALGLVYWGAVFTAYMVVLPEIDQGKGVYLTITWPQIATAVASGGLIAFAALPIPTAVV